MGSVSGWVIERYWIITNNCITLPLKILARLIRITEYIIYNTKTMIMKMHYESPSAEIVELRQEDVICGSPKTTMDVNYGQEDW